MNTGNRPISEGFLFDGKVLWRSYSGRLGQILFPIGDHSSCVPVFLCTGPSVNQSVSVKVYLFK